MAQLDNRWLGKRRRDDADRARTDPASLAELAEAALQRAFERRGDELGLHPALRRFANMKGCMFLSPVGQWHELCRIHPKRPCQN